MAGELNAANSSRSSGANRKSRDLLKPWQLACLPAFGVISVCASLKHSNILQSELADPYSYPLFWNHKGEQVCL